MDATELFLKGTRDSEDFYEAMAIARRNSSGRIWLIGGFVFRTIASQLYGVPMPKVDLDLLIERPAYGFNLPGGWAERKNRFGNPKLIGKNKEIDYVPLGNVHTLLVRKLGPTIENFLSVVPLTIHDLVFDVYSNEIIGTRGMDAIRRKVVEVADRDSAEYSAAMKGQTLKDMIKEKADSLGFTPVYP